MHLLAVGASDMPTKAGDCFKDDFPTQPCGPSGACCRIARGTGVKPAGQYHVLQAHRFFTCTVCTTLSPLPRMGACVNMTTGRLAAAAFSSCSGMQVRTHSVRPGQRWGFQEARSPPTPQQQAG